MGEGAKWSVINLGGSVLGGGVCVCGCMCMLGGGVCVCVLGGSVCGFVGMEEGDESGSTFHLRQHMTYHKSNPSSAR